MTYKRLGHERQDDLIWLCHDHHKGLHFSEDEFSNQKNIYALETDKNMQFLRAINKGKNFGRAPKKIVEPTSTTLNCGHFQKTGAGAVLEEWLVYTGDRRLTALPKGDWNIIHGGTSSQLCSRLTVAQERKGLSRIFIIHDESIIQKT